MARRTSKSEVPELRNWEDVNDALRKIAECEIGIEAEEARMNMKINDAKLEAEQIVNGMQSAIKVLSAQIEHFVDLNKNDMDGKSKELNFGIVGYRQSSRISYSTKNTEKIIEKMKENQMFNAITVKESINKDVLKLYKDKDIQKIGAKRITEDKFYLEADREKLRA